MTEISAILIFLVGGIIGFVICRITLGTKPTAAQQQKLDDSKAELDHYKSQVNNHFTNSAELMQKVASSYQALYTHMAGQSQTLLSDSDADALPFPQLKTPPEKKQEELKMTTEAVQETVAEATPDSERTDSTEEAKETKQETTEDTAPEAVHTDATEKTKETAAKQATQETTEDTAPEAADTDATTETNETAAKQTTDDAADTDATKETNKDEQKPKNQAT